jgi:predicted enzyme related to lactoylglutathione lyase
MSEPSEYSPGEFCWVELAVPDTDAAVAFYGELLGWHRERYDPDSEGYWYFTSRGRRVAGLESIRMEGQVPAWLGYVRVDDAAETAAKVGEAGGTVLDGPLAVPGDAGALAVCRDPEGAVFALWQPGTLIGAELVNEVGTWTWNNLMTRDLNRARDFYGKVFGWEATQPDEVPEFVWTWHVEGQRWPEGLGNVIVTGSEMPADAPPHWQVYLMVEGVDQAVETTTTSGGNLLFGPQDLPVGRMAVLSDPQGAPFAIIEADYPEPR